MPATPGTPCSRHTAARLEAAGLATLVIVGALLGFAAPALAGAGPRIEVVLGPAPIDRSSTVHATVAVATPTVAITALRVELDLPGDIVNFDSSLATLGGSCTPPPCGPNKTVEWDLGTLAAGRGVSVSVPFRLGIGAVDGELISVDVRAFDGLAQIASDAATVLVEEDPDFELEVDGDRDPVPPSGLLTYTLSFGNVGSTMQENVGLAFPIPVGTSFVGASDGGVESAGEVSWNVGTLLPGENDTREVTVQGTGGGPGLLVVMAGAQIRDSVTGASAEASLTTRIENPGSLELALEMVPDPVRNNEIMNIELTVINRDNVTVDGVFVQARVPDDVQAVNQNYTRLEADCTVSTSIGAANDICDPRELVEWNLGSLPSGEGATLTFPPQVLSNPVQGSLLPFDAFSLHAGGEQNVVGQTARVRRDRVLQLNVDEDRDPVAISDTVTYTLSYGNQSDADALGVQMSMPIPVGTSFVSASGGGSLNGAVVEWDLGTVGAGEGDQRRVRVDVLPGTQAGSLLEPRFAVIEDAASLPNSARASAVTRVETPEPLALAIELSPDPVRDADTLNIAVTVSNFGPSALDQVIVEARMPAVADTDDDRSTLGGDCSFSGNNDMGCGERELIRWQLGTLAPGAGSTFTFPPPASFQSIRSGDLLTVHALAADARGDYVLTRETVLLDTDPELVLHLDQSEGPIAAGSPITYTMTVGNPFDTDSGPLQLSLRLPENTSLTSAGGGAQSGDLVTWDLGSLAAGASLRREARVQVVGSASDGLLVRGAAARVEEVGGVAPATARGTAASRIETPGPLRLVAKVDPGGAFPGESFDAIYTVSNRSPSALTDVVIEAHIPREVGAFNASETTGGGDCTQSGSPTVCNPGERVVWEIGDLAFSQSVQVSMPPTLDLSQLPEGTLVSLIAVASDAGDARARDRTTLVVPEPGSLLQLAGALCALARVAAQRRRVHAG